MLIRHEGLRLKPYTDTVGKTTIGVGRNLTDIGITQLEAMQLLTNDIDRVQKEAVSLPWFKSLSVVRQDVVLDMIFNLGLSKLLGFKDMCAALANGNFERASKEMLSSAWAAQVGPRAQELAQMMRLDRYLAGSEIAAL